MRGFDFGGRFGLKVGIDRVVRYFVGFVNRRGLGLLFFWLLCGAVRRRLRGGFECAYAFRDPIKFLLVTRIGAHASRTTQQQIESAIEMTFCLLRLSGQRQVESGLVFGL